MSGNLVKIEDFVESVDYSEGVTSIILYAQIKGIKKIIYKGLTQLKAGDSIQYFIERKKESVPDKSDPNYTGRKDYFTGLVPIITNELPFSEVEEVVKILKIVDGEVLEKYSLLES